jgi:hypothetical protein
MDDEMTTQTDPSTDDVTRLRAELAELDRRTARLEARATATVEPRRRAKRRGSHRFWVAILLMLGTLLTPLSLLAVYVKTQVTDTGRYLQTVKPLASDPAVQSYVAGQISSQLLAQVDIEKYVNRALPRSARAFDGPLTGALESFTQRAILSALQTKQFATLWVDANRVAHAQLVKVLTGAGDGIVGTANGEVTIDLSRVAAEVKQELVASGITVFSNIPTDVIGGKITIFRSRDVSRAQQATKLLQTLAFVLPFFVLGCFGGAIALSRGRRRAFVRAAAGFTLGALLLWLGLAIGRTLYLDAVTATLPHDAAAALYDTLLRPLQTAVRTALVFSLVVVVSVFLSGPSRVAARVRDGVRRAMSRLGTESDRSGIKAFAPIPFVSHPQDGHAPRPRRRRLADPVPLGGADTAGRPRVDPRRAGCARPHRVLRSRRFPPRRPSRIQRSRSAHRRRHQNGARSFPPGAVGHRLIPVSHQLRSFIRHGPAPVPRPLPRSVGRRPRASVRAAEPAP